MDPSAARKLDTVVDHEKVAIGPVGITQAQVHADRMLFNGVHLHQRRRGKKPAKGIANIAGTDVDVLTPSGKTTCALADSMGTSHPVPVTFQ